MGKRVGKRWDNGGKTAIFLAFLAGLGGGCWLYYGGSLQQGTGLTEAIRNYWKVLHGGGGQIRFGRIFFSLVRWPALAGVLALFRAGVYLLPAAFFARGMILSLSALALSGAGGGIVGFLALGAGELLSIPVFFWLGCLGWNRARELERGARVVWKAVPKTLWRAWGLSAGWLALSAAAETWLLLPLLRGMAALMLKETV